MKLKAFYFLLPLVAAAAIFSFCTKEPQIAVEEQTVTNQSVTDRTTCKVTVTVLSGSVSVCGTNTSAFQCSTSSQGAPLVGVAFLGNGGVGQYSVDSAPSSIKITGTANPAQISGVTVSTPGGSITFGLGNGQTREVFVDATTCAPQ